MISWRNYISENAGGKANSSAGPSRNKRSNPFPDQSPQNWFFDIAQNHHKTCSWAFLKSETFFLVYLKNCGSLGEEMDSIFNPITQEDIENVRAEVEEAGPILEEPSQKMDRSYARVVEETSPETELNSNKSTRAWQLWVDYFMATDVNLGGTKNMRRRRPKKYVFHRSVPQSSYFKIAFSKLCSSLDFLGRFRFLRTGAPPPALACYVKHRISCGWPLR